MSSSTPSSSLGRVLMQDAVAGLRDGVRLGVGDAAREEVARAVRDSTQLARLHLAGALGWVTTKAAEMLQRNDGRHRIEDDDEDDPWVTVQFR